jgi:inhibitor of lysozyme (Ivy)
MSTKQMLNRSICAALLFFTVSASAQTTPATPQKSKSATAAPQSTPAAGRSKEPWEYLKEPAFKQAYIKSLGPKSNTAWLARRDGPAPEDKFITIAGERYVMNTFCANHACKDYSALLLYQPEKKAVYGTIYEKGKTTYIGNPPGPVATELGKLWKKEWRSS